MAETIVNKVAQSSLVTIDFDEYIDPSLFVFFDLKPFLFQEMILKEKDFRQAIKAYDWLGFKDKVVIVGCSNDAIIPSWAYMLLTVKLSTVARDIRYGQEEDVELAKVDYALAEIAKQDFKNKKVVVKGCGNLEARNYAYTQITKMLVTDVSSLMYGEPCSTVPVYKAPKS